jgi:hypothetical protein
MTTPCQNLYATPSLSAKVLGCIPEAIALTVDCTHTGDNVNGPFGGETLWDHTTYGGPGFVPDAWIYTGTASAIAPTCSSIPTPPNAVSQHLPEAATGHGYSAALTASGGTGSYSWTVQRGHLPPGLALTSNGTITGKPARNGTWTFGVQVVDAYGMANTATETIPVTQPGATPTASITALTVVATKHPQAKLQWRGSDSAGPGVALYSLRYRRAAHSSRFRAWSYPSAWQALRSSSITQAGLARGYRYCWSVRAIDIAGKASAWSHAKCAAIRRKH